jgi:hypothetical protein
LPQPGGVMDNRRVQVADFVQREGSVVSQSIDYLGSNGAVVEMAYGFGNGLGGASMAAAGVRREDQKLFGALRHDSVAGWSLADVTDLTRLANLERGIRTRRPQVRQRMPMSAPRRTTFHS